MTLKKTLTIAVLLFSFAVALYNQVKTVEAASMPCFIGKPCPPVTYPKTFPRPLMPLAK